MEEKRYLISEAAKMLEVEGHVLRYWETELNLHIKRNEMGHRYYDIKDIDMFNKIKILKTRGIGLKGIRELIARSSNLLESGTEDYNEYKKEIAAASIVEEEEIFDYREVKPQNHSMVTGEEKVIDFKMVQLQKIMNQAVKIAIKENNDELAGKIKDDITESVVKEMDNIMTEKEKREEERYRRLDEVLRTVQRNNEIIATGIKKNKKKRGWFK